MTVIRAVSLPADALAIARALGDRPGIAVLASRPQAAPRPDDARYSFVACEPVDVSHDLVPPPTASRPRGWNGAAAAPEWIGFVPYEALRGIERPGWTRQPDDRPACALARPEWRRYRAVVRVDHFTGAVAIEADDEASAADLLRTIVRDDAPRSAIGPWRGGSPAPFSLAVLPAGQSEASHVDRVRHALRLIAAGDVYEVNLARRIQLAVRGNLLALFEALLEAAPAPWSFYQDVGDVVVCGTSPELALSVVGSALRTCPLKGTRARGADAVHDERLSRALEGDPKELAELVMAVDVHRNDLGRVAVPGSVRMVSEPRVLAGKTVWTRVADIVARRTPSATLRDVFEAVLPCGSVTGAPKVRAMEVIAGLEPWRRSLYTGAFGYVGRDGGSSMAVAIRTLELGPPSDDDGVRRGFYFAGSGIVADSDPERELDETRWKAVQLATLGNSSAA